MARRQAIEVNLFMAYILKLYSRYFLLTSAAHYKVVGEGRHTQRNYTGLTS